MSLCARDRRQKKSAVGEIARSRSEFCSLPLLSSEPDIMHRSLTWLARARHTENPMAKAGGPSFGYLLRASQTAKRARWEAPVDSAGKMGALLIGRRALANGSRFYRCAPFLSKWSRRCGLRYSIRLHASPRLYREIVFRALECLTLHPGCSDSFAFASQSEQRNTYTGRILLPMIFFSSARSCFSRLISSLCL